jgi:hypothetical protein
MTSIAWLWWHIGSVGHRFVEVEVFGGPRTMASGWTSPYLTHHPIFTNATAATAALRGGWADLRAAVTGTTDEQFERSVAAYTYAAEPMRDGLCVPGAPGAEHPASFFVAGALNEVSHHATQVCTLRDLYAAGSTRPPEA